VEQLALIMIFYTLSVLALEVPSGVFADSFGKKRTFLISIGFYISSSLILIIAKDILLLIVCAILIACGKAFSSGSLDALVINEFINKNGKSKISKISTELNIFQAIGIALGCILGGYISNSINAGVNILLLIKIFLYLYLMIFTQKFIFESEWEKNNLKFKSILFESLALMKHDGIVKVVLICTYCIGFIMCSLEVYWQIQYISTIPRTSFAGYIGFISFLSFASCIAGNIFCEKILQNKYITSKTIYSISLILMTSFFIVLSIQNNFYFFILSYILWYFILGIVNIAEATVINIQVPNHMRATILSISSFSFQLGALSINGFSSVFFVTLGVNGIWLFAGILGTFVSGIFISWLLIKDFRTKKFSQNKI
ncbi:MAG: MFS transporter, partial [Proteocatella sp.]